MARAHWLSGATTAPSGTRPELRKPQNPGWQRARTTVARTILAKNPDCSPYEIEPNPAPPGPRSDRRERTRATGSRASHLVHSFLLGREQFLKPSPRAATPLQRTHARHPRSRRYHNGFLPRHSPVRRRRRAVQVRRAPARARFRRANRPRRSSARSFFSIETTRRSRARRDVAALRET